MSIPQFFIDVFLQCPPMFWGLKNAEIFTKNINEGPVKQRIANLTLSFGFISFLNLLSVVNLLENQKD
jgi:hypothetical protein